MFPYQSVYLQQVRHISMLSVLEYLHNSLSHSTKPKVKWSLSLVNLIFGYIADAFFRAELCPHTLLLMHFFQNSLTPSPHGCLTSPRGAEACQIHAAQIQRSDARLNHSVCQSAHSEVSRAALPTPGEHAFASFHIQSLHCKRARWFQCIVKRLYRYNFVFSEKRFTFNKKSNVLYVYKKYEVWTSTCHSAVCGGRMIFLCRIKSEECMKGESLLLNCIWKGSV